MHALPRLQVGLRGAPRPAMGRPSRLRLRRSRDAAWLALQHPGRWGEPRMPDGFESEVDKDGWRH